MDDLTTLIADIQRLRQDIEAHGRDSEARIVTTREIVGKLEDLRQRAEKIQQGQRAEVRPKA